MEESDREKKVNVSFLVFKNVVTKIVRDSLRKKRKELPRYRE